MHPCAPKFTSTLRIEVAFGRQGTYVAIAAAVAKGTYFVCKNEFQLQGVKGNDELLFFAGQGAFLAFSRMVS